MEHKGGRGKKAVKKNRIKRIELRFREDEYDLLIENSKSYKSTSEYIRARLFKKGSSIPNPIELLKSLDNVNVEMKRVGNNINQLAKYVNQRKGITSDELILEYEKLLNEYVELQQKLEISYRKIINL